MFAVTSAKRSKRSDAIRVRAYAPAIVVLTCPRDTLRATILDDDVLRHQSPGLACSDILGERLDEGILLPTAVLPCPPDRLRASFQTAVAAADRDGGEGD